jgi:hypothetical protein
MQQSLARARTYPLSRPAPLLLLRERIVSEADQEGERAPASPSQVLEPEAMCDWMHVHERLVSLGKVRAAHEREVCRWLLAAQRLGVHARIGYASLAELAERVLGVNARQTEEHIRVGRALGDLVVDAHHGLAPLYTRGHGHPHTAHPHQRGFFAYLA